MSQKVGAWGMGTEAVLLSPHACTYMHVYTHKQVHRDGSSISLPLKVDWFQVSWFHTVKGDVTEDPQWALQGREYTRIATENSKRTELGWSLHQWSIFNTGKYHLKFKFVTFREPNRTKKNLLALLSSNCQLSKSGSPPPGHLHSVYHHPYILSCPSVPIWSPCLNLDFWEEVTPAWGKSIDTTDWKSPCLRAPCAGPALRDGDDPCRQKHTQLICTLKSWAALEMRQEFVVGDIYFWT